MNVLVDTSVWVAHFKQCNRHLVALLEGDRVVSHPYVLAEVACGTPPRRHIVLDLLAQLESAAVATLDDVLELLERRSLYGRGCGFVDVSLIASALLGERTVVWTLDKRLDSVAAELNLAYRPPTALHA